MYSAIRAVAAVLFDGERKGKDRFSVNRSGRG